jgi:PIN domain nuclease of toxin-antitoxin system
LLDISLWEICRAVECGTLVLTIPPREWIGRALTANITVLAISPAMVARSCELANEGLGNNDSADQLIVAAALELGVPLATHDRQIKAWGKVPVLDY